MAIRSVLSGMQTGATASVGRGSIIDAFASGMEVDNGWWDIGRALSSNEGPERWGTLEYYQSSLDQDVIPLKSFSPLPLHGGELCFSMAALVLSYIGSIGGFSSLKKSL